MSDFPPISDELRPRPKLKRHQESPASDADVEANSRTIGERWGAATHLPTPAPPPAPPARVTSIRGYIPHYLDDELTIRAAERRVTKTFLILEALAKAYRVEEVDMVQDRRKQR